MECPKCRFNNPGDTRFCGNCGAPLHPSRELSISQTKTLETPLKELTREVVFAGRYELIENLGEGGMGKVYKVLDKEINEKVALKLLNPEVAADERTIERFRNELKTARKISHKNVCRIYHLSKEESTHYITMEYVPGENLKSTIKRVGQLSVGKTISIAKQVCEGLIEAHRVGVVHRDLKPQNIMIDNEGNARIMDFGIARSLREKGITGAGVMVGTPEYMSPEQAEGKDVDPRSDIYSLGVILYEMVAGRIPFEGDTPLSIAMKHKSETPKEPQEFNTQVSEDFNRMILKCMEKDKEKRYQKAEELFSELSKIERGIPTTERVIPKRKPLTSREITVTLGIKKLFTRALFVIALVVLAVIIWRLIPRKKPVPLASGKPSLAVMYFENNTGDESLDHWRKALSDLLIADLSQSRYLTVLSGEKLFNILEEMNLLEAKSYSSEDLKGVAEQGGVEHVLVGKMAMAGDTFRIDTMLHKPGTEELVGSERVEAKGEENIFPMVDELTKKIKANFRLSAETIAADIDEAAGAITTSSPEAYKYYSEGIKFNNKGDHLKSIPLMEMAVAIDPEFAMAYRSLAVAYLNLGYGSEGKKRLQKAFELSDYVSERERYYIQGEFFLRSERTYDKAIKAYNELLQLYPEDLLGNNNLGYLYSILDKWDEAIERLEVNVKSKDEAYGPYWNVARAYMAKGLYDKAQEVLEDFLNDISDNALIHFMLAKNYLYQRKYDLALAEAGRVFSLDPTGHDNFILRGEISLYKGDLNDAKKELMKLLEREEPTAHEIGIRKLGALYMLEAKFKESRDLFNQGIELAEMLDEAVWKSRFHFYLAYSYLQSGYPAEALEECSRAWDIAVEAESLFQQIDILHLKGLTYLKMESVDEAQKAAEELKELIQTGMNSKRIRSFFHLMGMIELEKRNFSKAIENFEKAIPLLPFQHLQYPHTKHNDHALYIYSLASAYYKAGDREKAEEEYERIISLTEGRLYFGDLYAKSFFMLGKVYEEGGLKDKAIEHYDKFLDLWKEANPGFPEVEDAKKRRADLRTK